MNQIINKKWGQESVITNTPKYCAKWLFVQSGYVCSEHRHRVKDETFHCADGMGVICLQGEMQRVKRGDTVHIPTGQYHYFATNTGMTLLEVSTEHRDSDVERLSESHALDSERDSAILQLLQEEV